ncbi:MAG: hypothetical protein IJZ79_03155 [Bacilli bacterium]|nr:hypothetical protein [Bacilli bacterium]MBQ8218725.1 hypothetical protein [Bacilli bacterium]
MMKSYAGLYCNDIENKIKNLLITIRTEQSIVGHVSRYSDRFQLVGVDCKRVEFNLLRGVKGVKGVALDVPTAAAAVANFQQIMMQRFKFMEQMQVNNVYKIKDKEVNYYEVMGMKVQFDEMFELTVDLDESDRNYSKMKAIYPEGRQPIILTIEEIYNGMHDGKWDGRNPQLPEVKGYNSYIDKNSIRMSKGIYTPKILLFLADELNELMTSEDYKSVDTVKQALGSIARLGRAAAVHLALACQRASGSTISTDLKNNIQMSVLLGGFDDGASQLMFEKDISQLAKPHIKGRGFIGSGNEIIETQTYYTQPENDWEFDDTQKLTYNNPVFTEQCKRRGIKVEDLDKGWVPQHKIGEESEDELIEDDDLDEDDLDDDLDDDEDSAVLFKSKPAPPRHPNPPSEESSEISFKTSKSSDKIEETPKAPIKVEKPEVSMADLEAMFGPSSTSTSNNDNGSNEVSQPKPPSNAVSSMYGGTPNRDRINLALKKADVADQSPNIRYDKTSTDPGAAATLNESAKPRIKLNIKQKPPTE